MVSTLEIAAIVGFAAGAVIFFGIGVFVARLAAAPRKAPRPSASTDTGDEFRGAGDPGTSPEQALAKQRDQAAAKYRALVAYTAGQKRQVQTAFTAVKKRIEALKRRMQNAERNNEALAEKAGRLTRELRRSEADRQGLIAERKDASRALEKMQHQLQEAGKRLAALSDVEASHRDLLQQVRKREGLYRDAEALRDENSWLKSQLAEAADLKGQIDGLRKENARLNAMGIVAEKPISAPVSSPLEGLGGSFQEIANRLSALEGSRGAVLADDLGLPIAGTGDHMEGMAGMAAVFSDVCIKVDALLPFGDVDAMRISDRQGLTVAMQPFEIAAADVIVTTMSVGAGPDRETIDALIAQCIDVGRQM